MSDWANFGGGGGADSKQASGKVCVRKEGWGGGVASWDCCWRVYLWGKELGKLARDIRRKRLEHQLRQEHHVRM